MNLEDLIDENGLQQDEWSLTKPTFGENNQLTVIGWSGVSKNGRSKYYILECHNCSQDPELFGEGYFSSLKGGLVNLGSSPCGCIRSPHWTKDQYKVRCSRKAKELGHTFLGFVGEWKGKDSKIKMLCEKHGSWESGTVHELINKGKSCPNCKSTKPDDVMIDSFFASGSFHISTKFWRSNKKAKNGSKPYWYMSCPDCGEVGESFSGELQKGNRSCGCSIHRQQECYINWLIDEGVIVALKFGIARDSKQRIKQQNFKSVYTIKQHSIYQFQDVASCKQAERECKKELETGIVLKRDMPDGYTETTYVYNLDKIIEIYERNGGVRQENT